MKTRPHLANPVRKSREIGQLNLIRLAVAAACFPSTVWAAPKGGEVVQGTGTITQNGRQTLIQAGNKSIIQYSGFDIARGESVRFIQPGKDSTVLNRVVSNDPTRIFGTLQSNGKVYLVNPFGIYFQNGSMINVGGLYAASGKLKTADFLNGKNNFTNLSGPVVNRSIIRARNGDVALAGTSVTNTGYITASQGTVVMSSGKDVLIGDRDGSVFVQVGSQKVPSPKLASGDIFSMAVVNSGVVRAKNIQIAGGSGKVTVSGKLDAPGNRSIGGNIEITGRNIGLFNAELKAIGREQGGTILIGGDYQGGGDLPHADRVFIDKKSAIRADAYVGNGGKVVVWSDGTTIFQGNISAKGTGIFGNGGSAEVSGKGTLSYEGLTDLRSSNGATGTLLLDPTDITLLPGDNTPVTGAFGGGDPDTFSGSAATSTLFIGTGVDDVNPTLLKQIATANVVVQTTSAEASAGNITVGGAVIYNSPNSLTLLADNNINVNFAIQNAASGAISLTAANAINLAANLSATGSITLTHGAGITQTAGLVSANTLNLNGAGAVDLDTAVANLVLAETGGAVVINETDGLSIRGTNAGSLNLTTAGAISQTDTLTVGGSTTLNAGATNDIVLDNVGNDFNSLDAVTGNNVTLVDTNALSVGNGLNVPLSDIMATSFDVRAGAGGTGNLTFAIGTTIQANTQSYRAGDGAGGGGAASLVDLSTTAPLFRNSAGSGSPTTFAQRQDAAIADTDIADGLQFLGIPTNYQLTSDEASVTIATGSKVAGSNLGVTAQTDISISGDLSLATLEANSNGTLQIGANIASTGSVSLTHQGDLSRSAGTITAPVLNLAGSGNVGTGVGANVLTTTVGNIRFNKLGGASFIAETDAVQLAGSTTGNLTLSSGAIGQSGALLIGGTTSLNIGASSITLDNAGNDFTGAVTLQNSGAFDVTLRDSNALSIGSMTLGSGSLTINAVGLTQTGAITQALAAGAVSIIGNNGEVLLGNAGNDFTGAVTLTNSGAGNVSLTDANALAISGITAGSGTLGVNAVGITQTGAITQAAGAAAVTITGNAGAIILDNATNDFTGAVALTNSGANDVSLRDANALSISAMGVGSATLTINGVGLSQSGAIIQEAGASAVTIVGNNGEVLLGDAGNDFTGAVTVTNSGAGNVSLTDANALAIAGITAGSGTLNLNAVGLSQTGAITQTAGAGAVTITGNAGAITLDNVGNDFTGGVTVTNSGANNVALREANALLISGMTLGSGTLAVIADGDGITQTGAITQNAGAGAVTILGNGGDIILTNPANDFTGVVSLSNNTGNSISLVDTNDLVVGNVSTSFFDVQAGASGIGNLTFAAATTIMADSQTLQAGDGPGGAGVASVVDALTNNPAFLNSAGTAAPTNFTVQQDGAIADANLATLAQFGGVAPLNFTLQSDDASVTISTPSKVAGSNLTLQSATSINLDASFSVVSLVATAPTINLNGATLDTTGLQTFNGAANLLQDTILTSSGGANISFNGTIDTAAGAADFRSLTVNTSGYTNFGNGGSDNIGASRALANLVTDAPGNTIFNILGGAQTVLTSGTQTYNDQVTLVQDTVFTSTGAGALGDIRFNNNLNTDATATGFRSLIVNTAGSTIFGDGGADNVGTGRSLASLATDAPGSTVFNIAGGTQSVLTDGSQTYGDAVMLVQDTILTSSAGAGISFSGTVDSDTTAATFRSLTVNTLGTTSFGDGGADTIGATRALAILSTDLGGNTIFNIHGGAQSVLTSGIQTYNDQVTLVQDATLSSTGAGALGDIRFNNTLNTDATATGLRSLIVNTAGSTIFGDGGADNVGTNRSLASLATDAPGSTVFNIAGGTQSVLTDGSQTYGDAVTLVQDTILTSSAGAGISFNGTVDSDTTAATFRSLTVNTSGTTSFGDGGADTIGATSALATLSTDLGGNTIFNILGGAQTVQTNSLQSYGDAVILAQNTILTSTAGGVTFATTLDSQTAGNERSLVINAPGTTAFNGLVGGTIALLSLTTDAPGSSLSSGVTTTGATTFNDATTLGGSYINSAFTAAQSSLLASATVINSGAGGTTFGGILNGNQSLSVNTAGLTLFSGAVGGLTPLLNLTTDAAGNTAINGGLVVTTGFQQYGDSVTVGAPATTFGGTNLTFAQTLDGASAVTINSSGNTIFNGIVGGTAPLLSLVTDAAGNTVINSGAVTTSGAQTYNDDVTLLLDTVLTSNAGGNISLLSTVDTAAAAATFRSLTVNTSGSTIFGNGSSDNVGSIRALQSLTTNAGGNTIFNILGGAQTVLTSGTQTYNDQVTLVQDATLSSTGAGALGDIRFNNTLNTDATATGLRSLIVNTAGSTIFGDGGADNVGTNRSLASLATDAPGSTVFNIAGGTQSVLTDGSQTYGDAVTLVQDTILTSSAGAGISFNGTVDSDTTAATFRSLTVNTSGTTSFGDGGADTIGATSALATLSTDLGGNTIFNILGGAQTVQTNSLQSYGDAVILAQNTILTSTAGGVTFATTLDSQTAGNERSLVINAPGTTAFNGLVGGTIALLSLTTDAPGSSLSSGVTTTGATTFNDATTLGGSYINSAFTAAQSSLLASATVINSGAGGTTFGGILNGNQSLSVNTAGLTLFSGAVGGLTPLLNLTTDAAGNTAINGGLVVTTGFQQYGDSVTVGAPATTFGGTNLTFAQTLDGASAVTINSSGNTIFNGIVGGTAPLLSLVTDAAGNTVINSGAVTTSGAQTYNDDVTLLLDTVLTSNAGGNISLLSTVDTAAAAATFRSLTVNTSGSTIFGNGSSDNVGSIRALQSLTTNAGGNTIFNIAGGTSSIRTAAGQTYGDAVLLANDTILTSISGDITFAFTLDSLAPGSPSGLIVNSLGITTFGGAVGSASRIDSLTTDAPGITQVNGSSMNTRGFQLYQDAVTLLQNTVFSSAATGNSGNITFASTIDTAAAAGASSNLTVNTAGKTTFTLGVGNIRTIARLITDAPGQTFVGADTIVRTSGAQTYNDAVVGAATFTSLGTGNAGEIRFADTLDGVSGSSNNLSVNTSGATIFEGIVGGNTRFSTFNTDAPGTSSSVGILATGTVTFADETTLQGVYRSGVFLARKGTTLSGNTRITNTNGEVNFLGTVNGRFSLTVTSPNTTEFRSEVGNLIPLRSVTTDSAGTTSIVGGRIITIGRQDYGDNVTIARNTLLQSSGDISFDRNVSGPFRLLINTSGATTFAAGATLQSLVTDAGGSTIFRAGLRGQSATVQTTGDQTYNDNVILDRSSRFVSTNGGDIGFLGSINSGQSSSDLTINTAGITRFGGDVGQDSSLQSITTDSAGRTILSGASIETSGQQLYQDPVEADGTSELTAGTALFKQTITGDSLTVSSTGGALTFGAPIDMENLIAFASGGDLFIPNASISRNLSLSSSELIHLNGTNYDAGGSILFNAENPVNPQTPFSTILAETGDVTINARQDFTMALHQRFFVTNGSLTLTANTATLGDTAASQNLTVNANSAVLLGRERLTDGQRQGDSDLGLSFVARTITFNAPLSYSDQSERQLANFSVEKGQPFVAKIIGVTLFEDVNISDQFLIDGLPIFQPVAGGVSQAEVAETIAGALSRKRDDKVAEDDNLSDEDVKKLGEIGVFSRFYDGTQDLSLEKQFLYYQRDAFQNPKVPANYKVVTRRLQRELVTEVLEQSSKVNEMLPACQAAIDKLQTEFKTTEAYTSEQAFLPYLETKLGTDEGKVIKNTLAELKVLFAKLPLLNLTNKEIDLAKNAISGRFPPTNLNSETDIALKRLLIENKQPEKATPVEKKPVEPVKPAKVASL